MSWLFKDPAVIMKVIVSWLFNDPTVTVTWLNFNHAHKRVKNYLKDKKIKLPKWIFFPKSNKIFMYLLAPLISAKF